MNQYKMLIEHFKGRGPLINVVLDGYGLGKHDHTDAVFHANTPFIDSLFGRYPHSKLAAHGNFVGLPGEKDLGGSEVGHLTLGAGMIIDQGPSLIKNAIDSGSFYKEPILIQAISQAKDNAMHLIGLLSDGNVHSHLDHFVTIIEEAARQGVRKCYVHALLDGRDVGIQSATDYTERLEELFANIMSEHPDYDYSFASAGGREVITMDRDNNWAKVQKGWKTHVEGNSGVIFDSINEGILHFREQKPDLVDQDCPPFNIRSKAGDTIKIEDSDVVIFMNFRADRAIEITRAFTEPDFKEFEKERNPNVFFAGMMVYDEDTNTPENQIMQGAKVDNPFGRRVLEYGLNQFRLAETQKFAHVTFFFNGGYKNPLDAKKEIYSLIDSDKVDSFSQAPAMKAAEIGIQGEKMILGKEFDYGLINFANADMVGHTGDFLAAVKAVEAVDAALKRICDAVAKVNGIAVITADHGNADEMIIPNKKTGIEEISTKHSINRVPLILFDPLFKPGDYSLKQETEDTILNLSMISGTNHILMGREIPDDQNESVFNI